MQSAIWTSSPDDQQFEVLWVWLGEYTFLIAVYHPPRPAYLLADLLDFLEVSVNEVNDSFNTPYIIIAGDFDHLPETEIVERMG